MTPASVRGAWATLACLAAASLVTGCTSVGPAPGGSAGPSSQARASAAPSTSAVAATTSAPASATAVPVTSVASSASASLPAPAATPSTAAVAAPPPAPHSTCTSLKIRVLRGSAAPGYEFAALQFENTGSTRCMLYGYPSVTLLAGGRRVGSDSVPDGSLASAYVLAPGQVAESKLQDLSTCQAPLSDQIRVVAPRSSAQLVRPIQLRACPLKVSRLDAPE